MPLLSIYYLGETMTIKTCESKLAVFPGFLNELVFVQIERNRRAATIRTWTLDLEKFEYVPNFVNDQIRTLILNFTSDMPYEIPSWENKVINNTYFTTDSKEPIALSKRGEDNYALFKPTGTETYLTPRPIIASKTMFLKILMFILETWQHPGTFEYPRKSLTSSYFIDDYKLLVTVPARDRRTFTIQITGIQHGKMKRPPVLALYIDHSTIDNIENMFNYLNGTSVVKLASNF